MLDRRGRVLAVVPSSLYAHRMAVRPGRDEVAVQIVDPRTGTNDLYLVDLRAGTRTPVTSTKEWAGRPVWSPDGSQLAYANQTRGILDDFHVKDMRSGQDAPVVQSTTLAEQPSAWSHDGRHVLIYHFGPNGTSLKAWSFESKRLTPFIADKVTIQSEFSPDDRYVAFTSLASGQAEVMVATFPESTRTWPVTTTGGRVISWSADGREILVATLSGHIAAYPVSTAGGQFSAGQPTILVRDVGVSNIYAAATRDHSRIVIRVDPDESKDKGEIRLLFGWTNRAPTR
jgi:Tol biopolymer transport system component